MSELTQAARDYAQIAQGAAADGFARFAVDELARAVVRLADELDRQAAELEAMKEPVEV